MILNYLKNQHIIELEELQGEGFEIEEHPKYFKAKKGNWCRLVPKLAKLTCPHCGKEIDRNLYPLSNVITDDQRTKTSPVQD